eukprot:Filipodium_phascolosomae@DN976_c0_g1_i1.p1
MSSIANFRVIPQKLKLKTDTKKKKRRRLELAAGQETSTTQQPSNDNDNNDEQVDPMQEGTGRLVTSGTSVHGFETSFKSEIKLGDKLFILHPTNIIVESRVVIHILSDRNCTIHEPFSSDLLSTTEYKIKHEGLEEKVKESLEASPDDMENAVQQALAKRIKKQKSELVTREKTGMWGYKSVRVKLDKEYTQEELLDMRVKKGRDKHCWC